MLLHFQLFGTALIFFSGFMIHSHTSVSPINVFLEAVANFVLAKLNTSGNLLDDAVKFYPSRLTEFIDVVDT